MSMHVIIGPDDFLVEQAAKRIIGDGVGLETIDSINSSNAELQLADIRRADESFSTPPFFDPVKVTWWKNVGYLPGGGGKRAAAQEVKEALEKFAEKLAANAATMPDNQHFILSGPSLLKSSVFAKTLSTVAEMLVMSAGKPWERAKEAVVRVIDDAAEIGLRFAPGVAERFVARVGTDARSLLGELDKMRNYLGDGAGVISEADVNEITSQGVGVEPEVWGVTDAIGNRDLKKALEALEQFGGDSGFAVFMTTVIEKFFRQLVDLKFASESGRMETATAGMAPFAVRKNVGFLRNWTLRELRSARARFVRLRELAVSGTASVDVLISCELVRICRRR